MTDSAPWWLAVCLSLVVVVSAWRAGSLGPSGAVAALAMGTLALHRSYGWGAFLVSWFVLASILSRVGRAQKAMRTQAIVAKGDRRDAWQVLANGGVFALAAGLADVSPDPSVQAVAALLAVGALTAAGADTWSTEIGTRWGGEPWSLRERRAVPAGTSGAITVSGSLASVAGGIVLASLAAALQVIPARAIAPVALAGILGAWADTLMGAWWQERRWCPRCARHTERNPHDCGTVTEHRAGWRRLDNDLVNALCTLVGASAAWRLTRLSPW